MGLEALRIQNLRCLGDTTQIPIRPITVLVGRNSSGKSTFLRAFPLLRQSVQTATESPILWYRDRYVDFGSLKDAINDEAEERTVTFEFSVRLPSRTEVAAEDQVFDVAMTLAEGQPPKGAYVQGYEIKVSGHTATLQFTVSGGLLSFRVNGTDIPSQYGEMSLGALAYLLPTIHPGQHGKVTYQPVIQPLDLGYLWISRRTPLTGPWLANMVNTILDAVDQYVADFMDRVAYLGPLRATAERSYRVQDLSVNDVDPDGKNLAMFMRSLSEPEVESFAAFTRRHLGFESKVHSPGIHAEILVKELHAGRHRNLVDIGFGYTEVLPLMAILWSTCCRELHPDDRSTSLLAIEQPELHLHPAHQAQLAGVIAHAWRTSRSRGPGREVKLMIETHSEGIVNGLGELIRKGDIAAADVQIVLFDQDAETRRTEVRLAGYTDDGALNDAWPFGFFAPLADD